MDISCSVGSLLVLRHAVSVDPSAIGLPAWAQLLQSAGSISWPLVLALVLSHIQAAYRAWLAEAASRREHQLAMAALERAEPGAFVDVMCVLRGYPDVITAHAGQNSPVTLITQSTHRPRQETAGVTRGIPAAEASEGRKT